MRAEGRSPWWDQYTGGCRGEAGSGGSHGGRKCAELLEELVVIVCVCWSECGCKWVGEDGSMTGVRCVGAVRGGRVRRGGVGRSLGGRKVCEAFGGAGCDSVRVVE